MNPRGRLLAALKELHLIEPECESNSIAYDCVLRHGIIGLITRDPAIFHEKDSERLLPYSATRKAVHHLISLSKEHPSEPESQITETKAKAVVMKLVSANIDIEAGRQSNEDRRLDLRGRPLLSNCRVRLHLPESRELNIYERINAINGLTLGSIPAPLYRGANLSAARLAVDKKVGLFVVEDLSWVPLRERIVKEMVARRWGNGQEWGVWWWHPRVGRMTVLDEGEFWQALRWQWELIGEQWERVGRPEGERGVMFEFWVEVG